MIQSTVSIFTDQGNNLKDSTWLTAGGIVAFYRSSESFFAPKLLTPIDLVKPNLEHSSMASQVPFMSKGSTTPLASFPGFNLTGKWIR